MVDSRGMISGLRGSDKPRTRGTGTPTNCFLRNWPLQAGCQAYEESAAHRADPPEIEPRQAPGSRGLRQPASSAGVWA
jgi:hypothetical protein